MDELLSSQPSAAENTPPPKPKGKVQSFSCPACGGVIKIHAAGHSITSVCSHCSTVVDISNAQHKIIEKARQRTRPTFLEIGSRGELYGVTWEIIGYVEKNSGTTVYKWDEYLLFNPYHGFRFLLQTGGHWNFFSVIKRDIAPNIMQSELSLDGKKYQIFERGEAVVQYVKGEFYWTVKKGDSVRIADYIAPPHMLSVEKNNDEIVVSKGEYVEPEIIDAAFKPDGKIPYRIGVAPNQPSPFQGRIRPIWAATIGAFLLATLIQIITAANSDDSQLYYTHSRIFADTPTELAAECADPYTSSVNCEKQTSYGKNKMFASPVFVMPKSANMFIESTAGVQNDWAELHLSLMNEETNKAYNLTHVIEYYFGRDSDGYWSEGKPSMNGFVEAAPPGTYRMLVEADSGAFQKNGFIDFSVNIRRDVPVWGNYWITVLLLLFYPVYAGIRHLSFENKRWAESDYAPSLYKSEE